LSEFQVVVAILAEPLRGFSEIAVLFEFERKKEKKIGRVQMAIKSQFYKRKNSYFILSQQSENILAHCLAVEFAICVRICDCDRRSHFDQPLPERHHSISLPLNQT
jgi:hypothetical protein